MNPIRWIDRLIFATILVCALQIPILSDQYRQYLAGYVNALSEQVESWQILAYEFDFQSVEAYIKHLESNDDVLVVKDAQNKRATLSDYYNKQAGLKVMTNEQFPQQVIYMLSPNNFNTLKNVASRYQPGIPLSLNQIGYSVVLAILIDILFLMPFWGAKRFRDRKKSKFSSAYF
ncbi:DUF2937 family protein [Alteromonas sp. 5E99-2]|uniref:DUF2937 family protein n=1 Tax=Alteromonas sp. 5E99-2 TaxID=2817683 RepID=UPI001A9A1F27|nr:DUF2937 family protein [Alteromonas sp. 5E99-2]MBO1256183.1 DUF2937 family protein [Alteromonas sp. 5E99-2]